MVRNVLLSVAASLLVASASSAEIFKCTAKNGLALYQNFPCDIDSLGSLPSRPAAVKPTPQLESVQPSARSGVSPVSDRAAPSRATALSNAPRAGMTADEVKAIWGEPEQIVQDEPRSGRVEIWQYGDGRSVQINRKQRVVSVQQ